MGVENIAYWFEQRGLSRREAAVVLGVHWTTVQAWSAGSKPAAPAAALWEALRMLEAAWGTPRVVEFVRGHAPSRWVVAMAVLAASVSEGRASDAASAAG